MPSKILTIKESEKDGVITFIQVRERGNDMVAIRERREVLRGPDWIQTKPWKTLTVVMR